jgi:hypothetical protein
MKLKNKEILNIQQGLTEALQLKGPGLSKVVYAVAKNARLVHAVLEQFHADRNDMLKAYGQKVAGKEGEYQIPPEKMDEFNAELAGLMNEEVEIGLHKLQWADLQERVSGSCIADLDCIIEFPPDGP